MCVPSYSVCLKGPQEKCVCCWHSPFNIVWIFHQDPSPVTRALCFQTCLYIPCVCVCVCVQTCVCARTCACLQRHYRHLFSLKCNILSIPLPLCTHSYVYLFFSVYSAARKSGKVQQGIPGPGLAIQLQKATLFQCLLCKGPWHSLECRSVQVTDKAWGKRGGLLCVPERSARD